MPYSDPEQARAAARERQRRRRQRIGMDAAAAQRREQRQRQRQADPEHAQRERVELEQRAALGKLTGAGARTFVAIDGESTSEQGQHRYVMLCSSTGHLTMRREGLGTLEILLWLVNLKRQRKRATFVCFGLGYDVNMWLRDVPRRHLRQLWREHETSWFVREWGVYVKLAWLPTKRFWVSIGGHGSVEVSEVFGFFQQSFLRALESWGVADKNGAIARIRRGKADRGGFRWRDRDRVRRYCLAECLLLVDLMRLLRESLEAAELVPRKWQGAGSVAAALLSRESSVAAGHKPDDRWPRAMADAFMVAYIGGRFEVNQQGELDAAHQYDIRSAYPHQARHLPNLAGAGSRRVRNYDPELRHTLWRVTWHTPYRANRPVMPFPYRHQRAIYYPERGHGWYWDAEVRAAIALWGDRIRVHEGWQIIPADTAEPFAFIDRLWALRAEAKAAGRAEEKALKLGLNSVYGKLAQGVGWKGRVPRFRSFVWAGMITSGTRARMLELAATDPASVVAFATDGVLFTTDPQLPTGTGLGDLEYQHVTDLFVAQSGVYVSSAGERRRGWRRAEIDWSEVLDGWRRWGPYHVQHGTARRFIGLGTALGRRDCWDVWRSWADVPRDMSLYPSRKVPDQDWPAAPSGLVRWEPHEGWPRRMSDRYVPKTDTMIDARRDGGSGYTNALEQPDLAALFDGP